MPTPKPRAAASGTAGVIPSGPNDARLMGGGPRLKLAEWVALIHLHRTLGHDRRALNLALATASERLEAVAAKTGRPRAGTRLRSPAGLARRLTVVRALADGRHDGLPVDAVAAWELFATSPDEARSVALDTLGQEPMPVNSEPAPPQIPSRGPQPSFGTFLSQREDGATAVYVMELTGRSAALLDGAMDGLVFVKVGRSGDTRRRKEELNWGFPPGCGLEWGVAANRQFPSSEAAHAFEQALLATLHRAGLCIGGEYARVRSDLASRLLDDDVKTGG